eukprot:1382409-Ditylum_brightwellii.AAC.1
MSDVADVLVLSVKEFAGVQACDIRDLGYSPSFSAHRIFRAVIPISPHFTSDDFIVKSGAGVGSVES